MRCEGFWAGADHSWRFLSWALCLTTRRRADKPVTAAPSSHGDEHVTRHADEYPAHPGGFVKREIVEAMGLSVTRAAVVLGVTRPALSALLNERAKLSPEMALRIEKVFGGLMDTLLRMQTSYDIAQTRKREGDIELVPFEEQVA